MLQLRKFYLCLFFVSIETVFAYTPITWIERNPNNLFSPPCCSNIHGRLKKCSPWQGHVRANLFSMVQPREYYYGYEGYGFALQGHLHMDRLLRGLYSQLYLPMLLVHEKIDFLIDQPTSYSGSFATIADIPILLGWEAIQRKSWHFSGYFVGTIPTAKHGLFHHGLVKPYVSYNHQFSFGPGLENFVRLLGNPKHHIDWLTTADITFWRGVNKTWVFHDWTNNSKILEPIRIHANQMYRIRSDLAYKFKHFISNIGVQYLYIPEEKISLINQLSTPEKSESDFNQRMWDVFIEIGWEMQLAELPSYITIGTQSRAAAGNVPSSWNINVKIGTQF